jgi:hypothetical protein
VCCVIILFYVWIILPTEQAGMGGMCSEMNIIKGITTDLLPNLHFRSPHSMPKNQFHFNFGINILIVKSIVQDYVTHFLARMQNLSAMSIYLLRTLKSDIRWNQSMTQGRKSVLPSFFQVKWGQTRTKDLRQNNNLVYCQTSSQDTCRLKDTPHYM